MSNSRHSSPWANAALVVTLGPAEFGHRPFDGVRFQEAMEGAFFEAGGGDYTAPAQRVPDFLAGRDSGSCGASSFKLGTDARPSRRVAAGPRARRTAPSGATLRSQHPGLRRTRGAAGGGGVAQLRTRAPPARPGEPSRPGILEPVSGGRRGRPRGGNHERRDRRRAVGPVPARHGLSGPSGLRVPHSGGEPPWRNRIMLPGTQADTGYHAGRKRRGVRFFGTRNPYLDPATLIWTPQSGIPVKTT